jgi:WD40 repeat protein/DNA-binding SARP family transcriptional activator
MRISLLGPVEAAVDGGAVALGGPKERSLLAMLALEAGTTVPVERLIDGLWGEEPPATAGKLVQLYVSHLRKAMAAGGKDGAIVTRGRGYELDLPREQVDVGRFERLLAQGAAREALALWRGPPLADVAAEPFAAAQLHRLEELRTVALELAIEQDLEAGRHREVLPELEALLAQEPLRERLHALRMLALYRAGRQAEALDAYRKARATLVEEIGIEPGPELRQLQEAILRQDPELALEQLSDVVARASAGRAGWRQAEDDLTAGVVAMQAVRERDAAAHEPGTEPVCPYKGLEAFELADAHVFFGRERLVAELVARVPGSRLLGIVGNSGSGKSSALRAGLLATLGDGVLPGSEGWPTAVMRPGERPVEALEAAQAELDGAERAILAVDQFEELFTTCRDEQQRGAFVDALLRRARDPQRVTLVLLAIRADFYGRCAGYPELSRALGANQVLVGPLQRDELRRAIELPARRSGVQVEPELVDALVDDVEGEPGALPLLSTALLELWDNRDDGMLELAAYAQTGGVRGAVARAAEAAYKRFDEGGRKQVRRVMLRLSGDGDVRARVPLAELDEDADVVRALAAERLLTLSEDEAELAHEALLREWPRLREWLEVDAEGRRLHRRLTHAARDWDAAGRDANELWRGSRLAAGLQWADAHGSDLNIQEREFVEASRAAAELTAERERRVNRRLRGLLVAASVLLAAAAVAGVLALSERGRARDNAVVADAQRLGAEALTEERLDHGVLLARAGTALHASDDTYGNLLSVLAREPAAIGELRGDGWPLYSTAVSDDGALLALGDERGGVQVYDARTRERLPTRYIGQNGIVQHMAFGPGGDALALAVHGDDGITRVDVIDPRTGRLERRFKLPPYPGNPFYVLELVAFSPDGRRIVAQQSHIEFSDAPASILRLLDLETGSLVKSRRVGEHGAWSLAATADRRRLFVTIRGDDATFAIDPRTLRTIRRYDVGDLSGGVSPDGRMFALGAEAGTVRLLDLRTGDVRAFEGEHEEGGELDMVFSPDGRTLVTGNSALEVIVWDVAAGDVRERFSGHDKEVTMLAISPDSRTLYTSGQDAKLRLWDLAGDRRIGPRFTAGPPMTHDGGSPKGVALSPGGETLAVTQQDGSADLLDAKTLRVRRSARLLDGAALAADFSPDGRLLAVAGEGGAVQVRDARTLAPVRELRKLPGSAQGLAFSPDGRLIAAGSSGAGPRAESGRIRVWEVRSGAPTGFDVKFNAPDIGFSPDGRLLAAAGIVSGTEVYRVADGKRVARLRLGTGEGRSVAFSPDGATLAIGGYAGEVELVSTRTWRREGALPGTHRARVTALEYSPDGERILTGSADGTMRLWDVATREPLGAPLPVETDAYVSALFGRDGEDVFVVPAFGRGARWDLRPAALNRHACLIAGRNLTEAEWSDVVPEQPFRRVC